MNKIENTRKSKKLLYSIIGVLFIGGILFVAALFYNRINQDIKAKDSTEGTQELQLIERKDKIIKPINQCRELISNSDNTDNSQDIEDCYKTYSLKKKLQDDTMCKILLTKSDTYIRDNFLETEGLEKAVEDCRNDAFKIKLSQGDLLNIHKDFKSEIIIKLPSDIYSNSGSNSLEDINKIQNLIKKTVNIDPNIKFNAEDISVTGRTAIMNVDLEPSTSYVVTANNNPEEKLEIQTPEKKYLGLYATNPLTLYTQNNLPKFEILEFDSGKNNVQVKICEIGINDYSALEVYSKTKYVKESRDFISSGLEGIGGSNCKIIEKQLGDNKNKNQVVKKTFDFDEYLADKQGLFYVHFENADDAIINNRVNQPVFFGKVNSHILSKISKEGEGFFFVNDMDGNPLPDQEIKLYINNYYEADIKFDDKEEKNVDGEFRDPITSKVFGEGIVIGKTDKNGILSVDLNPYMEEVFDKTFGSGDYEKIGDYNMFFIEASSPNYKSYLSSTWNGGIEPWNFGYKYGWGVYNQSNYGNEFSINGGLNYISNYSTHVYSDRVLYLPGETAHIKAVIRKKDFSIPKTDEIFVLKISDSNNEELIDLELTPSEFGSITYDFDISEDASLGYYTIDLFKKNGDKNERVGGTTFNVEIFQKPKFENTVTIEALGLDNNNLVDITGEEQSNEYYNSRVYKGDFKLQGTVSSKYYSGNTINNAKFTYKIFRQPYYGDDYWNDCYYGCYYEPEKEFYTEGEGYIGEDGIGKFSVDVKFDSTYSDYKYIVEVTVKDENGDEVTGANSIVAKLPEKFKRYNYLLDFILEPTQRFVKVGDKLQITGMLSNDDWDSDYNDTFALIIKKKNYIHKTIKDVNGYDRNIQKIDEELEKVILINEENFDLKSGKLYLDFVPETNGEYIFEYGKIDNYNLKRYLNLVEEETPTKNELKQLVDYFNKTKELSKNYTYVDKREVYIKCGEKKMLKNCTKEEIEVREDVFKVDDLLQSSGYFPIIAYDNKVASNPIKNDNKVDVLTEKISYDIGDTAKIFVRLPVENARILMTIEKEGVIKSQYFDVSGNVLFKELLIDESFAPNAYVSVFMVDTNKKNPEYKVGYTEIVVDKSNFKSTIDLQTDKKKYAPRDEVTVDIKVTDNNKKPLSSEVTLLVVDDALISLMGNINPNTLEYIYDKLPFSIQTAMSNIGMVRNYYFARRGIVGGSGFGNFKGGDSAVSSRTIFKNTAFYKSDIVTDENGKAQVKFTLPDNLTNFRVMAISNDKNNIFGYSEDSVEVRKTVTLEEKFPLILYKGDKAKLGMTVFNNTGKEMGFAVEMKIDEMPEYKGTKKITIKDGDSKIVYFDVDITDSKLKQLNYTISALGDSPENSDKIENSIKIQRSPILMRSITDDYTFSDKSLETELQVPENTDYNASEVEVNISSHRLTSLGDIYESLIRYPYGCIEQLMSSTLPNLIAKNMSSYIPGDLDMEKIDTNINDGVYKILKQQNDDGGFKYWSSQNKSNLRITPYIVRGLYYMKENGVEIDQSVINNAAGYLEDNYYNYSYGESDPENEKRAQDIFKTEVFETLALLGRNPEVNFDTSSLDRHSLLAYTRGMVHMGTYNPDTIDKNIQTLMKTVNNDGYSFYWNQYSDRALLIDMLIDYDFDRYRDYIDDSIYKLSMHDWNSYYYSTQTKFQVFKAFNKYLEKINPSDLDDISINIGNYSQDSISLDTSKPNITLKIPLREVINEGENNIPVSAKTNSNKDGYIRLKLNSYPADIKKIKPYNNGVKVKKIIQEVLDESHLSECSKNNWYSSDKNVDCSDILRSHSGNTYKKDTLYKARVTVSFTDNVIRHNITVEDYLPSTFGVVNSKFKTNSSSIRNGDKNWSWDHVEYRPEVVMASTEYFWGDTLTLEYFFRPEYTGTFVNPPVSAYAMYNPDFRAYSGYEIITVK